MSIEISSLSTQNSTLDYAKLKNTSEARNKNEITSNMEDRSQFDLPKDRYISHEEDETNAKGIYKIKPDANGKPKIIFDAPNPVKSENSNQSAKKNELTGKNSDNSKSAQCTGSTDKVDSEIKRLKNQKQQLERQIRNASEEETDKLKQELDRISSELMQKDNDSYRRAHTVFV